MINNTTKTYTIKRNINNFYKKLTKESGNVETKFVTNKLSQNLRKELSSELKTNYLKDSLDLLGDNPLILVKNLKFILFADYIKHFNK